MSNVQVIGTALASWFRHFYERFSFLEKITVLFLATLMIGCSTWSIIKDAADSSAKPITGGTLIEGVVGSSNIINPLYISSSVDNDLSRLVFSGLVKLGRGKEILPDLAESWEAQDKGRVYIFHLRKNVTWHDGEKFTANDVIFTIDVIQNEAYTGSLKENWQGITVEAIDDFTVKFNLVSPSTFFVVRNTFGILPQHLFAHLPVTDIGKAINNSKPVGTGPYKVNTANKESISLAVNHNYYQSVPYIEKVVFYYYDSERSLKVALRNGAVTSAAFLSPVDLTPQELANLNKYTYTLPQYKAVFINQLSGNKPLTDKAVRQALAYATDKNKIIQDIAGGNAVPVDSPILPGFWGHLPDVKKYNFDYVAARDLLNRAGWSDKDSDGVLEKDSIKLSFTLSFKDDRTDQQLAGILATDWRAIGFEVKLQPVSANDLLEKVIKPRSYDALIFGQDLGADSDPYAYWHSSQAADPGLALAVVIDKDIDNNLEQARLSTDINKSYGYLHNFQRAFADLVPAILLYQPNLTYLADKKVKGMTSEINVTNVSDRFCNINEWYIRQQKAKS